MSLTSQPLPSEPAQARTEPVSAPHVASTHTSSSDGTVIAAQENGLSMARRVLYRHRWPALLTFVVVSVAVFVYFLRATSIYEGRVTLLIEAADPKVVTFSQVIDQDRVTTDFYQTQYALLQSRALVRQTIETLSLWHHPELGGAAPDQAPGTRTAPRGALAWLAMSVDRLFRVQSQAPVPKGEGNGPQTRAITAFQQRLTVEPMKNSRLVEVRFQSADPVLAARVPNSLAQGYIEETMDIRLRAAKDASRWLGQQLAEQREAVQASEEALQHYREQNDGISLGDKQNIVVQKLGDLNAAVTRARAIRIEKQTNFEQVRSIGDNFDALDTFPAVLANPFIQRLKSDLSDLQRQHVQLAQRYRELHPEMIQLKSAIQTVQAKLQIEISKIVQSMRNEYLAAQTQEQTLVADLEAQKGLAMGLDRKAIEYGVLQRDAASTRQLFDGLLQRAKEMDVSGELKTTNIRIVDPAEVPSSPVAPQRSRGVALGLLAAAVLAVGLAFALEFLDGRIKSPDEIRLHLGVPFLALVPKFSKQMMRDGTPVIGNTSPPQLVEAFNSLRSNLLLSFTEPPFTILVTSAAPGEGKTLVASNLAVALANAGRRVLLIDADLRRARVHEVFGQKVAPGLVELMASAARRADAVRSTSVPGLFILPAGRTPADPGALMGSASVAGLLRDEAAHFDCVVLDSPPLLAVADATQLAREVDGVVFVVSAQKTARRAAQLALAHLDEAGAKILGAVLNGADVQHHGYYYSPYYRSEYGEYYSQPNRT